MTLSNSLIGRFKDFGVNHCHPHKARVSPFQISKCADGRTSPDPEFPFAVAKQTSKASSNAAPGRKKAVDAMGKSNKFDYTNKKNTGVALGQFIARQLDGEADKVKKSAERGSVKGRKQSVSSANATSDTSESCIHHIDLKAPGKDLGDDGVCTLADGLEIALRKGNDQASLALEDVDLSDNGLTTASLARLAPVIMLAKHDLKTFNIANNNIKVDSDEEAGQWEVFLCAFSTCFRLRRLDLSGNIGLGARAMEIFARVHVREPAVSPIPPGGENSVYSLLSSDGSEETAEVGKGWSDSGSEGEAIGASLSDGRTLKRRCGLRSIPFITLQNIGLQDTGALWLSYVLEDHHYPNQLVDQLNAALPDSVIKTYQQDHSVHGIDWNGNVTTLSKDGLLLLSKTESVRRQMMLDDQSTMTGSLVFEEPGEIEDEVSESIRRSLERRLSRVSPQDRRGSVRSIRTNDGGEHEATELESLRKKVQRHLIAEVGVPMAGLWRASLMLLRCSRVLMREAPPYRQQYTGEPLFSFPLVIKQVRPPTPQPLLPSGSSKGPVKLSIDITKVTTGRGSYAAKLTATAGGGSGETELAVTDATNTPTTPKMVFKAHRKGAFSEGTDLTPVTDKLNALIVRDEDPARFIRYQENRILATGLGPRAYRDRSIACHLPTQVVEYIISFVMDDAELEVMTEEQKAVVMARGQKRATLMGERECMRKDESYQVWMLLDGMNCLAYGR
ncbi:hypothetical protein LTR08_000769 [Meristemomyces frigidus]|nr:hypothetical protein LTR08_000769 [Meristemomyces frigidus]